LTKNLVVDFDEYFANRLIVKAVYHFVKDHEIAAYEILENFFGFVRNHHLKDFAEVATECRVERAIGLLIGIQKAEETVD